MGRKARLQNHFWPAFAAVLAAYALPATFVTLRIMQSGRWQSVIEYVFIAGFPLLVGVFVVHGPLASRLKGALLLTLTTLFPALILAIAAAGLVQPAGGFPHHLVAIMFLAIPGIAAVYMGLSEMRKWPQFSEALELR